MTLVDMKTYFDILQDKTNSAYFTDTEKEIFIDRAQIIFINEQIEQEIAGAFKNTERAMVQARGIENTLGNTDNLYPLIIADMSVINGSGDRLATSAGGILSKEDLDSAVTQSSGKSTGVMKVMSFAVDNNETYPDDAEFVRQNDINKFLKNDFTIPSINNPIWTNYGEDYLFYPKQSMNIIASVLRYPQSVIGGSDCELRDSVHDRIVSISLELAGLGSRDDMLMRLNDFRNKVR